MSEDLRFICEDSKVKAKRLIEVHNLLQTLTPNSSEYVIQLEVYNNILKKLTKYAEIIYTAILSYNNSPETFTEITRDDVLEYQLVQDEVTSMLKKIGIILNYLHPNDKKNDS